LDAPVMVAQQQSRLRSCRASSRRWAACAGAAWGTLSWFSAARSH